MKLTILGSGSGFIREKRTSASFLLNADSGEAFLLDAGWGAPSRLLQAGQNIQSIDHILISHPHADHIGSLMNILQSMLLAGYETTGKGYQERKRKKPLYLHGYSGFKAHYETLRGIMMPERAEPYEIKILEYKENKNTFGNCTISGTEVKHVPQYWSSSAFRIDADGKSIAYTGDCGFDERFIKLAKGADLGIFEMSISSQMYERGSWKGHLSPYECGLLASKAGIKRIVLVHLYDNDSSENIEKEVRKNFGGELIISQDLQTIKL